MKKSGSKFNMTTASLMKKFDVGHNFSMTMISLMMLLGRDFEIDLGGRTRYSSEQDSAEDPLFSWLSDELKERKTYSTFMKLMDNYS